LVFKTIQNRFPPLLRRAVFWLIALAALALALLPVPPHLPHTGWDKVNHAIAFAVLAVLGQWSYPRGNVAVFLGLLAYGGLIEALQALTPHRSAEWGDLLADGIGLALAWLMMRLLGGSSGAAEPAAVRIKAPPG
jgi:VanZ family protein